MDNELLYGDPERDPITNPNVVGKINVNEEASVSQIYSNATSITSEPIIPGGDINFQSMLPLVGDIDGASTGSSNIVNNIFIFLTSGSTLSISRTTILSSYDDESNWSVSIPISNLVYNSSGTIVYDTNTALRKMLNALGVYKENIICKSGSPIVEYYKI